MTRIVETAVGRLGPTHRADRNIEILGVAGAGKSTLARHLAADPGFAIAPFIHARRPGDLLLIIRTMRFDTSTSTVAQIVDAVRAARQRREGNHPGG